MDRLSIVRLRLRNQRLGTDRFAAPADAVAWLGAMQAQEFAEAKWSAGERVRGCREADVELAFSRGEILRTHVLRPTWHFVAPADIRWMLSLTAARVLARCRPEFAKEGLDTAVLGRSDRVLGRALADGQPLTRAELGQRLAAGGIAAAGPRLGHLMMHAELEQVVCSGPRRGLEHTYALLDDRAPPGRPLTRDTALSELATRYFRSRGPATDRDFSWWSGLSLTEARAGIDGAEPSLRHEHAQDGTRWISPASEPGGGPMDRALLVPTYDESVIAYKGLRTVRAAAAAPEEQLCPAIVVDGVTVGRWRRRPRSRRVAATLFEALGESDRRALDAAVDRLGRFLDADAELTLGVEVEVAGRGLLG